MPLDTRQDFIDLAKISPSNYLNYGPQPILIDEWKNANLSAERLKILSKFIRDRTGELLKF